MLSTASIQNRINVDCLGDPLVIIILTILGGLCAFVLVLPTVPESDVSLQSRLPSYLHMTSNAKVIASYILGRRKSLFPSLNLTNACATLLGLLTVFFIRRWWNSISWTNTTLVSFSLFCFIVHFDIYPSMLSWCCWISFSHLWSVGTHLFILERNFGSF